MEPILRHSHPPSRDVVDPSTRWGTKLSVGFHALHAADICSALRTIRAASTGSYGDNQPIDAFAPMLYCFTDEDTWAGLHRGRAMGHPIQIILTRQLAEYLSVPLLLVDPDGTLLFYNEPAESILGQRFEESGAMTADEWVSTFSRVDDEGQPIPPEDLPLMITLAQHRPAFRQFHLRGLDGVSRHIEAVSIPIVGLQGDFLGAASLFWEISN